MKLLKYLLPLFVLFSSGELFSQTKDSTQWTFSTSKDAEGNILLNISASIPPGMIIYSNKNPEDLVITNFEFDSSIASSVEIVSTIQTGEKQRKDPLLEAQVAYFESNFNVSLVLKLKTPVDALRGKVNYMGSKGSEITGPDAVEFYLKKQPDGTYAGGEFQLKTASGNELLIAAVDMDHPVNNCGVSSISDSSLFVYFILGLLGGLLALITPCVFPMIPLTVSFFTKKQESRSKGIFKASLYGLFIFLIYTALSVPFHITNVSQTLYNEISSNVWVNLAYFVIFVVFAISFFGYFEITLPSKLANSTDSRRGNSVIGIFFMALTLAIVSFSCTGPILGNLLVVASTNPWPLTAALAGFGLALGLPFALFALFPQWLSSLPKSGGWLTTVKVVLGFIELALALKFFSNADQARHWGLLKREVFIGIWILISLASFAYLFGWISVKKEYYKAKIGIVRRVFGLIFLAFAVYLSPGLLKHGYWEVSLISGFPPPKFYSVYELEKPLDDYFKAVELAKKANKPIMIDFTGWTCTNCRKMEENVWPSKSVQEQMDKFLLVSLYVDDKKELPADEQFVYKMKDSSARKIITIGDKWATLQSENFRAVSQPWYVLITPDGKLLAPPIGYTPDQKQYAEWLKCGYEAWEKVK